MQTVPVAVLDKDFAARTLIDPTFDARLDAIVGGKAGIPYGKSAFGLHYNHLDPHPFMDSTDTHSLFIVIVNRLATPLTIAVDAGSGDSVYYGTLAAHPTVTLYDERHKHYASIGADNVIPAASKDGASVGVGVVAMIQGSPFYGVGGGLTITTADPNLEGTPIWLACQFALGEVGGVVASVALTDDPSAYAGLRAFYDAQCDAIRNSTAEVKMAKGEGKDPAHSYLARAAVKWVWNDAPEFIADGLGQLCQQQVVVTLEQLQP